MTSHRRLEHSNQTTLVHIDADHIEIVVCHGELGDEDQTKSSFFDQDEFAEYAEMMNDIRVEMSNESWKHYCQVVFHGYGCDAQ